MALRLVLGKLQKEEQAIWKIVKQFPKAKILAERYLPPLRHIHPSRGPMDYRRFRYVEPQLDDSDDYDNLLRIFNRPPNGYFAPSHFYTDREAQIMAEYIVSNYKYEVTKVDFGCLMRGDEKAQEWLLEDLKQFNLKHGNYSKWEKDFEEKLKKRLMKLVFYKPQFHRDTITKAESAVTTHNQQQNTNLELLELIDVYDESPYPWTPSCEHLLIKACDFVADGVPTIYKAVVAGRESVLKRFEPLMSEIEFEAMKPVDREKLVLPGTTSKSMKGIVTKVKDPNEPKRPPTAYSLFIEDFWKAFEEELHGAILLKEAAKECGKRWRSLTDQEKKPYLDEAAKLKEECVRAMEAL